jgi:hypothetical protein
VHRRFFLIEGGDVIYVIYVIYAAKAGDHTRSQNTDFAPCRDKR